MEFTLPSSIKPPRYVLRFRLFFSCLNRSPFFVKEKCQYCTGKQGGGIWEKELLTLTCPSTACAFHPTPPSPKVPEIVKNKCQSRMGDCRGGVW